MIHVCSLLELEAAAVRLAAALVAYAAHFPESVADAAGHVRRSGPQADPNPLIVALGDELLELGGALVAAAESTGEPEPVLDAGRIVIPHPERDGS